MSIAIGEWTLDTLVNSIRLRLTGLTTLYDNLDRSHVLVFKHDACLESELWFERACRPDAVR